jgi:uncharacterized membrane protein YgcG
MSLLRALRRRPFLTSTEREQIDAGLATARRHADAPIGLVIEDRALADPDARAQHLFSAWELPERERVRAILVYACGATRRFAVVGGDEIRRVAPQTFWENLQRDLVRHFEEQRYCDGLFKAVANIAIMLHSVYVTNDRCRSQSSPLPEAPDQ